MLCNLPIPIIFQHDRSCMKQKFERKTRQQDRDFVNFLIDIRLNDKKGTQRTFSRTKEDVTWIVPMWVTVTFSPLGNWTKVDMELVILVNKVIEWIVWFVALVSRTQVSSLKAVLLTGLTTNIKCCMLKDTFFKQQTSITWGSNRINCRISWMNTFTGTRWESISVKQRNQLLELLRSKKKIVIA